MMTKYQTLHDRLRGPITEALKRELGIQNTHALPRLEKVVINTGINKSKMDSKEMQEYVLQTLSQIAGQQAVSTRAKQAISNFKIRQGMVIGSMVTLRGHAMEEFLDRLISYALPRIRDFRGLTTKLDGRGNYAIGIRDHSIFPEVPPADAKQIFGLQVQITTTAQSDEEARALLKQIGVPFRPEKKVEEGEGQKHQAAKAAAQAEAAKSEESNDQDSEGESASESAEVAEAPEVSTETDEKTEKDDGSVEEAAESADTDAPKE